MKKVNYVLSIGFYDYDGSFYIPMQFREENGAKPFMRKQIQTVIKDGKEIVATRYTYNKVFETWNEVVSQGSPTQSCQTEVGAIGILDLITHYTSVRNRLYPWFVKTMKEIEEQIKFGMWDGVFTFVPDSVPTSGDFNISKIVIMEVLEDGE